MREEDLDIQELRANILADVPNEGDLDPGTSVTELLDARFIEPHTGLLNEDGFINTVAPQVELAYRNNLPLRLIYLDMDQLKNINDTYGHDAGDESIEILSETLKKHFRRETDVVGVKHNEPEPSNGSVLAKPGTKGDEFYLAVEFDDVEDLKTRLEEVRKDFEEAVRPKVGGINASVSFGIADKNEMFSGETNQTAIEKGGVEVVKLDENSAREKNLTSKKLVKNSLKVAEMRMYEDKRQRKQERKK